MEKRKRKIADAGFASLRALPLSLFPLCRLHNAFFTLSSRILIQERALLLQDHARFRCDYEDRRHCDDDGRSSSTDPRRSPSFDVDVVVSSNDDSGPSRRLCPGRRSPHLRASRRRHRPGDLDRRCRRPPGRGRGRGRRLPLRDGADRRRRDRRHGRALPSGDARRLPEVRGRAAGRYRRVCFEIVTRIDRYRSD